MIFTFFRAAFILFPLTLGAQVSFYNGSFETHSLGVCTPSLTDVQFNSNMWRVKAFGKTYIGPLQYLGKTSVQDSGCYVVPQNGKWCIGLRSSFGPTSDAVAIELTDSLVPGMHYDVSFYLYGNTGFQNFQLGVDVGESLIDSGFGNYLYSAVSDYLAWKNVSFSFTASQRSKYITVKIVSGYNSWNQLDNFVITQQPAGTGMEEYNPADFFSLYPNPASGNLNIQFANDPETHRVEIYNELGQLVVPGHLINTSFASLDVSFLPRGLYSIHVSSSTANVFKKLVISK